MSGDMDPFHTVENIDGMDVDQTPQVNIPPRPDEDAMAVDSGADAAQVEPTPPVVDTLTTEHMQVDDEPVPKPLAPAPAPAPASPVEKPKPDDVEMEEADLKKGKTIVLTKKLSAEQRKLVMDMDPECYPRSLDIRDSEENVIECFAD